MKLADFIGKELRDAIAGALADDKELLTAIAEAGGKAAGSNTLDDVGNLADILTLLLGPLGVALGIVDPPIAILEAVDKAAGKQGRGFAFGYAAGYAVWQLLQPAVLPLQHAISDLTQTEIFDPNTAAELEAQGIINNAYGRSEAAGGNLSGEHYDKMVDAAQVRPDLSQLLDLWNRGLIKEADVDTALQHHKVPAFWWPSLKFLRRSLLSPADLALNNLRGEISAEDAQAYAAVQGLIPEDFQRLVQNTGEPPGPEQLMEAWRRNFIDEKRFQRGIRQSRVRDEWIDVESALRFQPISTADAVRAVVEGHISDDEGKALAVENGLIADQWEILVKAWGRPPSHEQMLELYHRGLVTIDQVKQAILESDIKNKYVEQLIELGRQLVPQRTIILMLQHGVIPKSQAHTMLTDQGYNDQDAEAFIALGMAEHKSTLHTLTKTDVTTAYEDKLMNKQEAINRLVKLGFTAGDSEELLDLADTKAQASTLRAVKAGIQASLKAGHLTTVEAKTQLVRAGIDARQATQLIDEWTVLKGTPTRSLTEAQILKLGETGLITSEQCRARLEAYGLVPGDATLILQLHGIIKAPDHPGDLGGFNPGGTTPGAAPL